MKIKRITWQMRNDFCAVLECEHCGCEQDLTRGYSDGHYYRNVIPAIACKGCGLDRSGKASSVTETTPVLSAGGE